MEQNAKKEVGIAVEPEPEFSPEFEAMIEEDIQFWNFHDISPDENGELPQWKYSYP